MIQFGDERFLEMLAESFMLSITDAEGNVIYVNENLCKISGYKKRELVGKKYQFVSQTHNPPDLYEEMNNKLSNGLVWKGEVACLNKDGSVFWLSSNVFPLKNQENKLEKNFTVSSDITKEKLLEQRNDQYRVMVARINEIITTYDADTAQFTDANNAALRQMGYTMEEFLQLKVPDLEVGADLSDMEMWKAHIEDIKQTSKTNKPLLAHGVQRRKDGTTYPVEVSLTYEEYEGRKYVIAVSRDITERKETEMQLAEAFQALQQLNMELITSEEQISINQEELRQSFEFQNDILNNAQQLNDELAKREQELRESNASLEKTNQELRKTNHELDHFVYSVSHDLRAPIASILGLINLHRITQDAAQTAKLLDMQEVSILRLDGFIKDILDYSRNARGEIKSEHIDFQRLMDNVFMQYNFMENAQKIDKKIEIVQQGEFFSDMIRLHIVLGNLVSNAIRYANLYQEKPELDIKITCEDKKAIIKVQDNGIGIGAEHLNRVGEMFYRATDRGSGSGLGLYIARETVAKLSGTFSIQSQLGKGTSVIIEIPSVN